MAEHSWHDTYEHALREFGGQTPRAHDEQTIIDVFATSPLLVRNAVDELGEAFRLGRVKWPWSALASRVQRGPSSDIVVDDASDRDRRIRNAKAWIHNAGCHIVHEHGEKEIIAELFGPGGLLHEWAADEALRDRMLDEWRTERERGQRCEVEALERVEQWKENREQVDAALREVRAEHEQRILAESRDRAGRRAELTAVPS